MLREEVANHNRQEDCWVILNDYAYDVTRFLNKHPGGRAIIMKYAGKDASRAFNPLHRKDIVNVLPKSAHLGPVTPSETPPPEKSALAAQLLSESALAARLLSVWQSMERKVRSGCSRFRK